MHVVSNEERRRVAQNLRSSRYRLKPVPSGKQFMSMIRAASELELAHEMNYLTQSGFERLADLIEPQSIDGNTSDGYHTFDELYHHRAVLFSVIVENFATRAWKSKLHADGTMYEGMFIVGIETPDGQATYHYDVEPYWDMFRCKEVDRAPEWDGHTPDQAIERIGKLVDCKTDRPTTKRDDAGGIYWRCHRCGAFNRKDAVTDCSSVIQSRYCANCGADVVE